MPLAPRSIRRCAHSPPTQDPLTRFSASSHACLSSVTLALLTLSSSRSPPVAGASSARTLLLRGAAPSDCGCARDSDDVVVVVGGEEGEASVLPLAAALRERAMRWMDGKAEGDKCRIVQLRKF